ncbi:TPA: hypothetical protein DEW47_00090 [Patescibacteria group bacterium]|nr:MAG: Methyltransferase type 11 [Parcubacteria group bacterium GW2011_GWF2_40_10]KKR58908.1 MAG: Methyltransferase type 11 [Parcubacteria group bacterium GW2011_GWC2_40_31]KKR75411.1 MAG: Methyltransferase type 11 [Parcubacteria group bacterium GW2011_GWB2_40_8]KKR76078.1 MAG: Methyltransferase type 11 [Parcubacteria group bacterium GW2011_GWE2_40_8]KKR81064.1 MAG: Methyltransferase type 11 [Parcubacteria group bacterium GW2011_GWD2_40_9]HCI04372.1 hypothetical protein [Patescibacteria group
MTCLLCNKKINKIIATKIRNEENRSVYYCDKCELGMLDDKKNEQELKEFYSKEYREKFKPKIEEKTNPQELFDAYSPFQQNRVNLIKKHLKKNMRLLEIGCSAGMFLYQIKKYVKEIAGIDYDLESAKFASEKCKCHVFTEEIEQTDLEKKIFDVICVFQTLEHTKNPYNFLSTITQYLKPGGIIYLEVPNLNDVLIYAYNLPYHYNFYFHSAHLWYFTNKSLGKLCDKIYLKGKIYFSQDYNFLNHMNWIINDAPQKSCAPGLSLPYFPLRNGVSAKTKNVLDKFIKNTDKNYKEILVKHGISSNLSFIGRLGSKKNNQ